MSTAENNHRLGVLFLLASIFLIATSDAVAKIMTAHVPVMQIALIQSACAMLVVAVVARGQSLRSVVSTRHLGLQSVRAGCHLVSSLCFYLGLRHLPLADMVAIIFIGPLLITLMAAYFLGEQVGMRRWVACGVGLLGALVIVRPGLDGLGWPAVYPLVSVTAFSVYVICTRRLAPTESPASMLFYSAIGALAVLAVAAPWYWVPMAVGGWAGLLAVGLLSSSSSLLSIRAYALAPASLLAPYAYTEIVAATAYGFAIFGDVPDAFTVSGAAVIVASGLYVYHRDRRSKLSP